MTKMSTSRLLRSLALTGAVLAASIVAVPPLIADDGPELIFKRTTVWKFLSPDHKLATYAIDDPVIDGVTCHAPKGAFYCFPNLTGLLGRDINGVTASSTLELADLVLDQAKVAFVPGEAFGAPGYGRFSFALGDDDMVEGIRRIAELVG